MTRPAIRLPKPFATLFALAILLGIFTGPLLAQSSVIVVDASNRKIHVAGNPGAKRSVGGLAKIATTMVALDWSEASKVGLSVLATVPDYAQGIAGAAGLDLQPGDKVTLRDLIYATMMTSDDVAAITLGHFVGNDLLVRRGHGGDPLEEFAKQMNALAGREGCMSTHFVTPHGFENSRPMPYSTAADIARLALYAASRAPFHFYANQKSRSISVFRGAARLSKALGNTNPILGVDRIDGMKYASTPNAGGCIAVSAERPSTVIKQPDNSSVIYRHRMVVIVLGSANPADEARAMLQQGWAAYDSWLAAGRPVTDRKQLLPYF